MQCLIELLELWFLVLGLEGDLVTSLGLMNFVEMLSDVSRQLINAGGAQYLLPVRYYLVNPSVRLMNVMRMLVLDLMQSVEKSLLQLLQLGIGEAHRRSQFWDFAHLIFHCSLMVVLLCPIRLEGCSADQLF